MLEEMFETLKQINEQVDGAVKVINEQKKLLAEYEKENAELKKQIDIMKPRCKSLCKNYSEFIVMESDCIHGTCRNCDKWEMIEGV